MNNRRTDGHGWVQDIHLMNGGGRRRRASIEQRGGARGLHGRLGRGVGGQVGQVGRQVGWSHDPAQGGRPPEEV